VVLSCISQDSSIEECNSALIHLEKHSDEKALQFFDWMKANGKLKGNADAYHLALQAIAWKEDWKMAELCLLLVCLWVFTRRLGTYQKLNSLLQK